MSSNVSSTVRCVCPFPFLLPNAASGLKLSQSQQWGKKKQQVKRVKISEVTALKSTSPSLLHTEFPAPSLRLSPDWASPSRPSSSRETSFHLRISLKYNIDLNETIAQRNASERSYARTGAHPGVKNQCIRYPACQRPYRDTISLHTSTPSHGVRGQSEAAMRDCLKIELLFIRAHKRLLL
ncbi:hypothetical protein Salat_2983000 [Sesamum alatum]|uniref:Uncharacterized protein n=1 Tax=Sesamum alatum TaxID=300844 RepID=A0AAE1XIE8_9LAMI|nr:hypothetical protein Salat_2983000 [Sesamum alatum]